jgi:hypothetical protein
VKAGSKVAWILLAVFVAENAIGALRYLRPAVPFSAPLDKVVNHRYVLALRASGGGIDQNVLFAEIGSWRVPETSGALAGAAVSL